MGGDSLSGNADHFAKQSNTGQIELPPVADGSSIDQSSLQENRGFLFERCQITLKRIKEYRQYQRTNSSKSIPCRRRFETRYFERFVRIANDSMFSAPNKSCPFQSKSTSNVAEQEAEEASRS